MSRELWENKMHVRSTSRSAAAFKAIAGKYANNQLLWCLLMQEQKKKEEINHFYSFKGLIYI